MQGNSAQGDGRREGRAIVVIGVSGSGKSTIGEALARSLGALFLEGDAYHSPANIAKMSSGAPLTDTDRWPWLEAIGHAIGAEAGTLVAACSALRRAYREALVRAAGRPLTFIHLTVDPAVLAARMQARPHFMPVSLLQSQLDTLEPLAADEGGTEIVETGDAAATVVKIRQWLEAR